MYLLHTNLSALRRGKDVVLNLSWLGRILVFYGQCVPVSRAAFFFVFVCRWHV